MKTQFTSLKFMQTPQIKNIIFICFICFGFISKTVAQSDFCATAPVLNVSTTCNVTNFTLSTFGNEIANPTCLPSPALLRDGWFQFTSDDYTQYIIQAVATRNYSITIYQGSCGALVQVAGPAACVIANQNVSSTMTLTLNPNTTYYVRIGIRSATAPATGSICIAKYCTSTANNTASGTAVRNVNYGSINNSTNKASGYTSYVNLPIGTTTVIKGTSNPLSVSLSTGLFNTASANAWIDWNQNGVFEAGERINLGNIPIFSLVVTPTSNSPVNVLVPLTAKTGTTVMRISAKNGGFPTACEVGFDGEVEDYSIEVQDPNASITSFTPGSNCMGSDVVINGTNFSSATDVLFNTVSAESFTINSSTRITAVVPYSTSATGKISVITPTNNAVSATDFTVLATPDNVSVNGAGTYCVPTTITATGGTGGTIYFQGTNDNGTSIGTPSTSELISASGTYYFRSFNGTCWGKAGAAVVVINSTPPAVVNVVGGGAFCGPTTITASGGAGGTIYFQGTTSGGTSIATPSTSELITTSGTYYFRSYNNCVWGAEGSVDVTVNTIPAPVVVTGGGTFCGSAVLTATGGAGGTIYFQGTTPNNTATNLGGSPQTVSTAGKYYFRSRSSEGCWGAQDSATVGFVATATFSSQPTNKIVCIGQNTNFSVTVSGGPVTYQWRIGTTNLINGGNISGANSATLVITGVTAADAALDYNCVVTDACGSITSNFASLTVNPISVAPLNAASRLTFISSATSIIGSFAPAPDASAYLVIRTTTATAPTSPTNGNVYAEGTNALGGFVVSNSASTSFFSTGLAQNTTYYYWIFSYNINSCGTSPLYYNVPLSGNATTGSTIACGTIGNLFWAGLGSDLGATTSGNLNLPENWSTNQSVYLASQVAPTSCTNVTINVRSFIIPFFLEDEPFLSLTNNLQVRDLTFNANQGVLWIIFELPWNTNARINVNGFKLDVFGDAKIDMTSNNGNTIGIGDYNAASAGEVEFKADVSLGAANYANGSASSFVGNNNSKITFKGSVALGRTASVATASAPGKVVFDGTAQALTWLNTQNPVNFKNVEIGTSPSSNAVVILGGTSTANPITGNLVVKGSSVLNLSTNQWNRSVAGGSLQLNDNSKLIVTKNASVAGQGVIVPGSNFPGGFVTSFSNNSTVEYFSANNIHQTVNPVPTYGNLMLTNSSGSGNSNKILTSSIAGITGDLIVNPFSSFNMVNFLANRNTEGGAFTMGANAKLLLWGSTGGAGVNNNFPKNFATKTFHYLSQTTYKGDNQGIYGDVVYGGLILDSVGTKTAPSGNLVVTGLFNKISPTVFAHNDGTVIFNGTAIQNYSAVAPTIVFNNLTNNNPVNVVVNSDMAILKELKFSSNGRLRFGLGNVTLLSSVNSTANVSEISPTVLIDYNSGSGRFIVERYINTGKNPGQHLKSWQFVAANVTGVNVKDSWMESGALNPGYGTYITDPSSTGGGYDGYSPAPSLKYYNAATDIYLSAGNANSTEIKNDFGYMLYVRGDRTVTTLNGDPVPTKLRAKGRLVTLNRNVILPAGKFQSLGNPYASSIDFEQLQANSTGMDPVFYAWDPTIKGSFASGGYQTFTETTGYIATGGGSDIYAANEKFTSIQSGQAIIVKNASGGGTARFTESLKLGGSKLVNRTGGSPMKKSEDLKMFTTMLYTNTGKMADQNRVVFDNLYNNDIDQTDALKVVNAGENFGIRRQQKNLIVESRSPIKISDTIYYNMAEMQALNYKLVFAVQNLNGAGQSAVLVDKFTNERTAISITDTTIVNFAVTANAQSKAADRFYVVFSAAAGPLPVMMTAISANRNADRSIAIQWKVENEIDIQQYEVQRSADGQQFVGILSNEPHPGIGSAGSYTRNDLSPLTQDNYYRIKATSVSGTVQYSAIVKVPPISGKANIGIFPNPVKGKTIHIQFTNQPPGEYNILVLNKVGQKVYTGVAEVSGTVFTKSIQLNHQIPSGSYQLQIFNHKGKQSLQFVVAD